MVLDPTEKKRRQEERRQIKYNEQHKIINGVLYKKCNKHKELFTDEDEWLPCNEEYFYKNKINDIDGFFPYCKKCDGKVSAKWQKDNPDKNKRNRRNFDNKRRDYILEYVLRQRESGYQKEYLKKHPEKIKEYAQRYSNKAHRISEKEWEDCKDYFKNRQGDWCCAYCGMTEKEHKLKYNQQLHKEHVDCEGKGNLQNCVPACRRCNDSKHKKNMEEWYKKQKFFNEDKLEKIKKWVNEDYEQYIIEKPELLLPYIIKRTKNINNNKQHYELWSKDENGNKFELLSVGNKKKDLDIYIEKYYNNIESF